MSIATHVELPPIEDGDEDPEVIDHYGRAMVYRRRCVRCAAHSTTALPRCYSCGALCSFGPPELMLAKIARRKEEPYVHDQPRRRRRGGMGAGPGGGFEETGFGGPGEIEDETFAPGGRGRSSHDEDEEDEEDVDALPDDEPEDLCDMKGKDVPRIPTGLRGFDSLFLGGLPKYGFIMHSGTPGVGKSRHWLEVAARLAHRGKKVLYIPAEEPKTQITNRSREMKISERYPKAFEKGKFIVYKTDNLERMMKRIDELRPDVVILDSLFMTYSDEEDGAPGDAKQLLFVIKRLYKRAWAAEGSEYEGMKKFLLVGIAHMTKGNVEAGANRAKHWVDAAISSERADVHGGTRKDQRRPTEGEPTFVRSFSTGKNRFGPADVVGHTVMRAPLGIPEDRVPIEEGEEPEPGGKVALRKPRATKKKSARDAA